jgi:hypothetical protein
MPLQLATSRAAAWQGVRPVANMVPTIDRMERGATQPMTALQHPDAIRHFQSVCDACQELAHRHHGPSELRLYADGYLHALRRTAVLDPLSQRRLEELVERWIMDPSSFIGADGDPRSLYEQPGRHF